MHTIAKLAVASLLPLFTGCTSLSLVSEWRDESYGEAPFNRILVIGTSEFLSYRRTFEDEFIRMLALRGTQGFSSAALLPSATELNRETFREVIEEYNMDAVAINRVVEVKEDTIFSEESEISHKVIKDLYHRFDVIYEETQTSREATVDKVVVIEINLYEVEGGSLVWSGLSENLNPTSRQEAIKSYAAFIAKKIEKAGLLRKPRATD